MTVSFCAPPVEISVKVNVPVAPAAENESTVADPLPRFATAPHGAQPMDSDALVPIEFVIVHVAAKRKATPPWGRRTAALALALVAGCTLELPEPAPLPPGSFAFGVFGDGPYGRLEGPRFRRLLEDIDGSDSAWLLHVGDILWYPCSNEAYAARLASLNSIRQPVIYTPGDNEWSDCFEPIAGEYAPLDRLRQLRATFFAAPGNTFGGEPMPVETQSASPDFAEFVENVRWRRGGFLFITLHMVGGGNAMRSFAGRSAADDAEVERRTAAALAWMEEAFAIAGAEPLHGIVIALHGNPGLGPAAERSRSYEAFHQSLTRNVLGFDGTVLLIHGDTHTMHVDQPLIDPATGLPIQNFTRLETFGSPDIGWVRVVVDTVAGRVVSYEPRLMPSWWLW
ncbi:MAG: hypothetical protein L0271_12100 [Gemmatimonadetes bacterium]|nr:hypothetical protein [Gemmatimonadota bacterium]